MVVKDPKVKLIHEGNFYYVLTSKNSEQPPIYKTCFPYVNGDQSKVLDSARKFGNSMAEHLGTKLVERL